VSKVIINGWDSLTTASLFRTKLYMLQPWRSLYL